MPLSLADFDYQLPPEKIAQTPAEPRDGSRLLVVNRTSGEFTDQHFSDLTDILTSNDVLVVNDTKVFPARLMAQKESGKNVELLLEKEAVVTADSITWEALTKPGLKVGNKIGIPNTHIVGICTGVADYTRTIKFPISRENFFVILDKWAKTPIPPYIRWNSDDEADLRQKYQTVYAARQGAVAAPTAGLHFTPELLDKLQQKGITIAKVTLHVGLGTFLPVKTDDITAHHMHSEWFELTQPVAVKLNEAKRAGKRIIAVGTTTTRVLETCADSQGVLHPGSGDTQIFIYPPYRYKFLDGLITNFHTPKSTLLMLVSALVSAPNTTREFTDFAASLMGQAYTHALTHSYRFYSFGDAMLIV